jgi:membrane-associated protease RseP (regulator of RpoE activity)
MRVARHAYTEQTAPGGRLKLTADDAANTLVIEGPTDQVLEVVKLVAGLEELGRRNAEPQSAYREYLIAVRARSALQRLAKVEESRVRPRLGVSVEPVSAALADQLSLPKNIGLLVTNVAADSPAAKVGIQANDVLVKIDGAQIPADVEDFVKLIANLKSDTPMDVVVMRKGQRQNLGSVRLGADAPTSASKRATDLDKLTIEVLTVRISQLESDVAALKDRAAWSERMAKKGFMTEQEVQADRARLRKAEMDLDKARTDLKALSPDPNKPAQKERKPQQ